jgi:hypothetical protein
MLDTRGIGRFQPGPSVRSTLVTESAFGENSCCGAGELCCSIAAPLHQDPDAKKDAFLARQNLQQKAALAPAAAGLRPTSKMHGSGTV